MREIINERQMMQSATAPVRHNISAVVHLIRKKARERLDDISIHAIYLLLSGFLFVGATPHMK